LNEQPSYEPIIIDGNYYHYDEYDDESFDRSTSDIIHSKIIDDNEEFYLDMLYDNALDDGPILFDDPPCRTIVTNSWEDKNDKLAGHNDALIH
jgi:hypothetical protein